MTETMTAPVPGANFATDPETWHKQRAGGITATQVRDLAKGSAADRRRIMKEKITGQRTDLSGNRYVEHGNIREPIIAAWITQRFQITESDVLYACGFNPRYLATPDGVERDPFTGEIIVSEIKTSKHDLTPGKIDPQSRVLVLAQRRDGTWVYDFQSHFASTGYYDQMQWQMLVMGAERTLFVWEQHDSNWPDPKPIHPEPLWCWVLRDENRIAKLIEIADDFLAALDRARVIPDELSAVASDDLSDPQAESAVEDERAELARQVLRGRALEAEGKAVKEAAWKRLQELAAEGDDFELEAGDVRVSFSTSRKMVPTFDEKLAREKAAATFAKFDALRARYTRDQERVSRTLNVSKID